MKSLAVVDKSRLYFLGFLFLEENSIIQRTFRVLYGGKYCTKTVHNMLVSANQQPIFLCSRQQIQKLS